MAVKVSCYLRETLAESTYAERLTEVALLLALQLAGRHGHITFDNL